MWKVATRADIAMVLEPAVPCGEEFWSFLRSFNPLENIKFDQQTFFQQSDRYRSAPVGGRTPTVVAQERNSDQKKVSSVQNRGRSRRQEI